MVYPTLARLCKRLLAEGKIEDVLDVVSSFKDIGPLRDALDNHSGMFPWGMKRAIVDGYNEWVEQQASDPAKLVSSFKSADLEHYSEETLQKLAYVLRGVLDPDTGYAGTVARSIEVLKSVPENDRRMFMQYAQKKLDSMSSRAIKAYYAYNDPSSFEREFDWMIRDDFQAKAQFDALLRNALVSFKQYVADANDETKGIPPEYQNEMEKLLEIYRICFKFGSMMKSLDDEIYDLKQISNVFETVKELLEKKADPSDPEAIGALTRSLKKAIYNDSDRLIYIGYALSNLNSRIKDFEREEDPYFKRLSQQIPTFISYLKNMEPSDIRTVFKVFNVKDPDNSYDDINITNSIQTMIEMGPIEYLSDNYYARAFYEKFKKLPEMMQKNFATIMQDSSRAWIEEQKKEAEELRKKVPPEAKGEDAPYQDYAFADQRNKGPKKVPAEPNTPEEENLFRKLKAHFRNNTPISVDEAEEIREILRKEHYRKIFHEPKNAYAYRGMKVPREWLEKAVGWGGAKMEAVGARKKFPDVGKKGAKFTFTPRSGGATSWTVDLEQAIVFASGPASDEYSIIIAARVKDNPISFVAGPGGLYDVPGLDAYPEEEEAVALGRIKVMKVFWRKGSTIKRSDITSKPKPKEKDDPKPKKKDVYGGSLSSKTKKKPIPKKAKAPPKKKAPPGYY